MDDEAPIRLFMERVLTRLGYQVVMTCDGEEAVAAFQSALHSDEPFQLVILDLTVPGGGGGQQTLERLLAIDPEVRAIVCSGYADSPAMAEFQEHGFKGFIAKPFTIQELSNEIRRVLDGSPQ